MRSACPSRRRADSGPHRDEIAAARTRAPSRPSRLNIAFLYLRGTAINMLGGPGSGADSLIAAARRTSTPAPRRASNPSSRRSPVRR